MTTTATTYTKLKSMDVCVPSTQPDTENTNEYRYAHNKQSGHAQQPKS